MKGASTLIGITSCLVRSSGVSLQKFCVIGLVQKSDIEMRRNYSGKAPVPLMGLGKG